MGFILKVLLLSSALAAAIVWLGTLLPTIEPNPWAATAAVTLPVGGMALLLFQRGRRAS